MAFDVLVTDRASLDIDLYTEYVARDSQRAAATWKSSLEELIHSLAEMPERFSVIPEADDLKHPYRSAMHYSHRVIFRIDEASNAVYVVRVYHRAGKPLTNLADD